MPRHEIPNVPPFERNHDAGGMAMLALECVLRTQGDSHPAWWLAGTSGDAFKFVYDAGAVFEPLRDRAPLDVLTQACRAAGWSGHWLCGARVDEVISVVRESVRQGRPVITPFLGDKWYHGLVLIVGIDEGERRFLLQIARDSPSDAPGYETVPIPEHWDGPVPGAVAWADIPLFVLDARTTPPAPGQLINEALLLAATLYVGPPLAYADHPGAQCYSGTPLAGRTTLQGEAALAALRCDIAEGEFIGFDTIWRIDAQLGQLHYDRSNAARFLRAAAQRHPSSALLLEASDLYAATAEAARQIMTAYWDKRSNRLTDQSEVRAAIGESSSLVYAVADLPPRELASLRRAVPILETPWGLGAIADSPRRRRGILATVDRIIVQERRSIDLLRHAVQ